MTLPSTKEIILRLKEEKERNNYSIPQIQRMCESHGLFICLNTFRNIFAKGSEDCSFSYEHTIRPIANALLPDKKPKSTSNVTVTEEELELLARQLQREREEHRKTINYLDAQIKSQRKTIEEKDKIIKELLSQL